ncbi:MFS transporter [Nocardia bovistercoris]|uniref:MFS transporter n=1 Tax=Nocardia bovistercoris TaxID=2785916 RepID=A0A931ICQ4_9NOCA|nr:MFS transporter [Nocardia bovistercoris]MBH0777393.1 MFS transporter [Nocardia bovistercoris]
MPMPTVDRRLRSARGAVFTIFALNGFLLALWVVHIPAVSDRTGIAKSTLGTFVLVLAGAALIGMRSAGPLADRHGSRVLVAVAGVWISVTVLGPGLATGPVGLGIALALFGLGNGALDVSMNTQAVLVERAYGRPIMSAFHALFSGGGLLGSLLGAAAQRAGMDIRLTLGLATIAGLILVAAMLPLLLRRSRTDSYTDEYARTMPLSAEGPLSAPAHTTTDAPSSESDADEQTTAASRPAHALPSDASGDAAHRAVDHHDHSGSTRKVLGLAVVAFLALLTEGAAADWSALQAREHLGADDATAALAFGAFSCTMTAGRFATDRIAGAFGRVAVVRYGTLGCAAGLALVVLSGVVPLTLLGWALVGLGLSGTVPQIFTAAGNLGSATAATDMSRVFSFGYLGLLAGPALIGWLTALVPLTAALVVPLVAALVCAWSAGIVAPPRPT